MIAVLGAGAFGTGLACALATNEPVILWGRDPDHMAEITATGRNDRRLPGIALPAQITATADLRAACSAELLLLAVPLQQYRAFLSAHADLMRDKIVVACSKGLDFKTGSGPVGLISAVTDRGGILSGPSFAKDIAAGTPTALTLAMADGAEVIQHRLSTPTLRIYRTDDVVGVELGGALKNVMAIACGAAIGGGFGESARAAILTRAYQEMMTYALHHGGRPETLTGLAGFGDLVLTCTSEASRNYQAGMAVGRKEPLPNATIEGIATAHIVAKQARAAGLDLPVIDTIARVLSDEVTIHQAVRDLLNRPLRKEN